MTYAATAEWARPLPECDEVAGSNLMLVFWFVENTFAVFGEAQFKLIKAPPSHSECWIAECTSTSVSTLKLCQIHGGYGFCAHPGCYTPAGTFGGSCLDHVV